MNQDLLTILFFIGIGFVLLALLGLAPALHERRVRRELEIRNARDDAEEAARLGVAPAALPHPPRVSLLDRLVRYLGEGLIWILVLGLCLAVWWIFVYLNSGNGTIPEG